VPRDTAVTTAIAPVARLSERSSGAIRAGAPAVTTPGTRWWRWA
jgi:hypothetical protein